MPRVAHFSIGSAGASPESKLTRTMFTNDLSASCLFRFRILSVFCCRLF